MKKPSIRALLYHFRDLTKEQAMLIRRLCEKVDEPETLRDLIADTPALEATDRYIRQCYSDPMNSAMWRRTMVLHAIDVLCGTHGVEALGPADDHRNGFAPPFEYLNTGDMYAMTLVYKTATDNLYFGCPGNIVENHPSWP